MEIKKKKINFIYIIIGLLFLIFISLYLSQINGYYEYKNHNKMILTKEAMEKFEEDVEHGENLNINNYLSNTYKDYSNNISRLGLKTSNAFEYIFKKGIKGTFKVLSALFVD